MNKLLLLATSAAAVIAVCTSPRSGPTIPTDALVTHNIQALDAWEYNHDPGTSGTATGDTSLVDTPSLSGSSRKFVSSYTGWGGEIYHKSYGKDTTSTHLVYDARVWIEDGSDVENLEMDSNQVLDNGDTVIYAFQCAGDSKTWDYSGAGAHWVHSKQPCNPADWKRDVWHHVQIAYNRNPDGTVTYEAVWLDSVEQQINETVPSTFALGWGKVIQTQFQIDGGKTPGSSVVYLDDLSIYRW